MSIVENKIINSDYDIRSKYIDFDFDPYIDTIRIGILENIMSKLTYNDKKTYILDIINSLSELDRKDPILPNDIYEKHKSQLMNGKNNKLDVNVYEKDNIIYFSHENKTFELKIKNYNRIRNRFEGNIKLLNLIVFTLLSRYNVLRLLSASSGSINPKSYRQFEEKYNVQMEGFSSFYNNNLRYYCGLFPDLEKHFGCIGNVFNTKFNRGISIFNPPFYVEFMNSFFKYIVKQSGTKIYILPAFKISDRKILNKICKIKKTTKYADDYEIQTIRDNDNVIVDYLYCKENFTYYDFLTDKYVNFAMTNVIVSNVSDKIDKIDIVDIFGEPDYKHSDFLT